MVSINSTFQGINLGAVNSTEKPKSSDTTGVGNMGATVTQANSSNSVSSLGRQLSDAATRAELRDSTLNLKTLGQTADSINDQLVGNAYQTNKIRNDAEVPNTDDPELLARARQATGFVNGTGSNPFKGMSRDQLALITYDEGGEFTVNERRAAWQESTDQEQVWRRQTAQKAMDEYNSTGKMTNFFTDVLDHFKGLPAIEQAQYPESYASDLLQKIGGGANYKSSPAAGTTINPLLQQIIYSNQERVF
ncbi:hypothetical protein QN386_20275 [Pseudomonas sp. CCI3.2]|uniref:hypothetical protein n=1 Tax=unclassified Pseudomonas TaxID=196821 RepID=UPI002AC8C83F|nr:MULTISPECIES: hypothetical protein [unclassified Pseudomonas]MEB0080014.1 hypothetical protein [Pseudomonas sp. MH10out]MEB0093834.1 hypothetical protein [Pseudomonas sp. CCI4.2]MEB0103645.1 hypothetical protein [Pseudomonas sp. CCI3.2]MEB0132937.1 hypothetical protein [Pseudomonas sp. CCI2.4]MEB0160073.1 hypothetical protein [Pseudomonas sp. AH2 (2023)]